VLETVAKPSEIMVATTNSGTVSMKEARMVNYTVRILDITALTGNRAIGTYANTCSASHTVLEVASCPKVGNVDNRGKKTLGSPTSS
jgi:hypothetical protein